MNIGSVLSSQCSQYFKTVKKIILSVFLSASQSLKSVSHILFFLAVSICPVYDVCVAYLCLRKVTKLYIEVTVS